LEVIRAAVRGLFSGDRMPDSAIANLIRKAKQARTQINRVGFQWVGPAIPREFEKAYHAGIPAIVELLKALDRLVERLQTVPLGVAGREDRESFADAFNRIYSPGF
jgi:hypothetical protein